MSVEQLLMVLAFLIALVVQAVKRPRERSEPSLRKPERPPTAPSPVPAVREPPRTALAGALPVPERPKRGARVQPRALERVVTRNKPRGPHLQSAFETRAKPSPTPAAAARLGLRRGDTAELRRMVILAEVIGRPRSERD